MYYRICKDGTTVSRHDTFKDAMKALRALHLSKWEDGFLDEVDGDNEFQLCQKIGRKIYQDEIPI